MHTSYITGKIHYGEKGEVGNLILVLKSLRVNEIRYK